MVRPPPPCRYSQHLVTKGPEPARDAIVAKVAPQVRRGCLHAAGRGCK